MKWIHPDDRLKKIRRCEYCNSDVSGPIKGVHEETELINGIPAPCRNNGRLNVFIAHPNPKLENAKEDYVWFVEHPITHEWYTGFAWTKDPNEAFQCNTERAARRFALLKGLSDFTVTEHTFV